MRILLGAAVALLITIGFGTSNVAAETPPATTTTTTPTATPPPVPDASKFRDELLALALANLDAQAASNFSGFFPAWKTAHPGLGGDGSAVASTPGRVSIYYNLLNSKDLAGPENPTMIVFAVADTQARCAGAAIYGFPKTDKNQKFPISGPCTAANVVTSFRAAFTVTPSPATTVPATATVAPKPPTVGNSLAATPASMPWTAFAVLLAGGLLAGAAGLSARRGRVRS